MSAQSTDRDLRLRLELISLPTVVSLIRSLVGTLARTHGFESDLLEDMRTAISEACNNVVLHAYPSKPGPLIFSLTITDDVIRVVVRDQGSGIRPGATSNRGLGMGVALINSLADRAEFESSELGTEVRMRFTPAVHPPGPQGRLSLEGWALTDPAASDALRARSN